MGLLEGKGARVFMNIFSSVTQENDDQGESMNNSYPKAVIHE